MRLLRDSTFLHDCLLPAHDHLINGVIIPWSVVWHNRTCIGYVRFGTCVSGSRNIHMLVTSDAYSLTLTYSRTHVHLPGTLRARNAVSIKMLTTEHAAVGFFVSEQKWGKEGRRACDKRYYWYSRMQAQPHTASHKFDVRSHTGTTGRSLRLRESWGSWNIPKTSLSREKVKVILQIVKIVSLNYSSYTVKYIPKVVRHTKTETRKKTCLNGVFVLD